MRAKKIPFTLKEFKFLTSSKSYLNCHRKSEASFSRKRKLPFQSILSLVLRKSVKSIQLVLNEWCKDLDESVSASAFSQARQKFSYTAFIELLDRCVVKSMYLDGEFNKYKGHRLLAIDGSTLRLPTSKELIKEFGTIEYMNGKQKKPQHNVESKVSVLYDVLNEIPISASMHKARTNDLKAASQHLDELNSDDVLIADRGYGSYRFFAEIAAKNANFIIRLKSQTYNRYHKLLDTTTEKERIVTVPRPYSCSKVKNIEESLKIRFIRVNLPGGEIEILATSLIDRKKYPYRDFKKLYHRRWRIETYYQTIKSRLAVDNFTGKTVEAVKQDFHATMFVSGLETILAEETNEELSKKQTQYQQQVNKAVSFHAIKDQIILLMFDPPDDFEQQVKKIFRLNPTLVRPYREKTRQNLASLNGRNQRSLHFQKFTRKHVF